MKKFITILVFAFIVHISETKAQSTLVSPIGVEIEGLVNNSYVIDINIVNTQTNDVITLNNNTEVTSTVNSLSTGIYRIEFTLEGVRQKIYFNK